VGRSRIFEENQEIGVQTRGELQFVANDSNHYKFTGKERDAETGLDYFGARYYSNGLGRFITPDWAAKPVPVPYAKLGNPQSLNLYSYVINNPLSKCDLDGHDLTVRGDYQADYVKYAQKASGLTLKADENGKISITNSPKKLSALGKAYTKLISDQDHHVSIAAQGATSKVFIGQFDGNGHQTLNFQTLNPNSSYRTTSAQTISGRFWPRAR
jgi:RHS repeat-associated protein